MIMSHLLDPLHQTLFPPRGWGLGTRLVNASLVPRPHHAHEERVWYTSSAFLGAQDAVCHVTVMTTHRFGIATHQPLSRAAIAGYKCGIT